MKQSHLLFRHLLVVAVLVTATVISVSGAQSGSQMYTCTRTDGSQYQFFGCPASEQILCPEGTTNVCISSSGFTTCTPIGSPVCGGPTVIGPYTPPSGATQPTTQTTQTTTPQTTTPTTTQQTTQSTTPTQQTTQTTQQQTTTQPTQQTTTQQTTTLSSSLPLATCLAKDASTRQATKCSEDEIILCPEGYTHGCTSTSDTSKSWFCSKDTNAINTSCVPGTYLENEASKIRRAQQVVTSKPTTQTTQTPQTTETTATATKNYSCVDRVTGMCKEDPNGSFRNEEVCQILCKESERVTNTTIIERQREIVQQPATSVEAKQYSCVDREKKLCEERPIGKYATLTGCQEECSPELPFNDEASGKKFLKKLLNEIKEQRLDYKKADFCEESDCEKVLSAFSKDAKALEKDIEKALKNFDTEAAKAVLKKNDQLEELSLNMETKFLEASEFEFEIPEEVMNAASKLGFNEKVFDHAFASKILNSLYQTKLSPAGLKLSVENLTHVGKSFQEEMADSKAGLFERVKMIEGAVDESELTAIRESLEFCVKPQWDASIAKLVETKLKQVILDLEKLKPDEVARDVMNFCSERNEENLKTLFSKGATRFRDVDTIEWYFSILQDPKQIAIKGSDGYANPKGTLKKVEALLAILRTLQTPAIEAGECANVKVNGGGLNNVPDWGSCAISRAIDMAGSKPLQLKGSVAESATREGFALWVWKLSQEESLTKNLFQSPSASDIASVCGDFKDCGTFKNNKDVIEAVAAMRVNGFMSGKKSDFFGFGQTLIRAEAAKVLLLMQEKIQP